MKRMTEQQKIDSGVEIEVVNVPVNDAQPAQDKSAALPDPQAAMDRVQQRAERRQRMRSDDEPGQPAPRHRMPQHQPRAVQVDVPPEVLRGRLDRGEDESREQNHPPREWRRDEQMNGDAMGRAREPDGSRRMPLPPRLMDDGPRQVRGFIGADKVWENNGKFLTIPGAVFFGADFISTTMGLMYAIGLIATKPGSMWWVVAGGVALYFIYAQVTLGPALWFSIRNSGQKHTKVVRNRRTGQNETVRYTVTVDWVTCILYLVHAVPDMILTVLFFWSRITFPFLVAMSSGGEGPSSGAKAIGVALCILLALLASIIPVVILIRNGSTRDSVEGGAGME